MKKTNHFEVSVAINIDIFGIYKNESVSFNFKDNEKEYVGDFELTVYNSNKKNTEQKISDAIEIDGQNMLIKINPKEQKIEVGTNYYEIFNLSDKRLEFFGNLKIER